MTIFLTHFMKSSHATLESETEREGGASPTVIIHRFLFQFKLVRDRREESMHNNT